MLFYSFLRFGHDEVGRTNIPDLKILFNKVKSKFFGIDKALEEILNEGDETIPF